jgi:hypothetical protein
MPRAVAEAGAVAEAAEAEVQLQAARLQVSEMAPTRIREEEAAAVA